MSPFLHACVPEHTWIASHRVCVCVYFSVIPSGNDTLISCRGGSTPAPFLSALSPTTTPISPLFGLGCNLISETSFHSRHSVLRWLLNSLRLLIERNEDASRRFLFYFMRVLAFLFALSLYSAVLAVDVAAGFLTRVVLKQQGRQRRNVHFPSVRRAGIVSPRLDGRRDRVACSRPRRKQLRFLYLHVDVEKDENSFASTNASSIPRAFLQPPTGSRRPPKVTASPTCPV